MRVREIRRSVKRLRMSMVLHMAHLLVELVERLFMCLRCNGVIFWRKSYYNAMDRASPNAPPIAWA
jgi:hypothetical protein